LPLGPRPETKAVERLDITVIGVYKWYIDSNRFNLEYFPLDTTFRADSEHTPFSVADFE
jgi:hypothetical protein